MKVIRVFPFLLFALLFSVAAEGAPPCPSDMALVAKGTFAMGDADGPAQERPVHDVFLDDFCMDRTMVTNSRFAEFLNEKGNREEGGKKWLDTDCLLCPMLIGIREEKGRFRAKKGQEDKPVVKVTWYAAKAYCDGLGKTLPTEAQWEKAARGGLQGKKFPWGDTPEGGKAHHAKALAPVGSFSPNGYGLFEMTGNAWQWVEDWYGQDYYARSPAANPRGPAQGESKVLRGGSWFHEDCERCAFRAWDHPKSDVYCFVTGFRCVRERSPAD